MIFTVKKEHFSKALQIVGKAVNTRSPLPILSNVFIKTEKGMLKLVTSNLQVTITTKVGAKIDEDGEITVPARIITDFVNQVKDEKIEGKLKDSTLHLQTDSAKAHFSGISASEFPEIPEINTGITLKFKSADLVEILQKVQFAVAVDEGRPVLTGIYLKITKDNMIFACTDGFRMAEYQYKAKNLVEIPEGVECIVPAKSFVEVVKSFASESEELELVINNEKNLVIVKGEDLEAQVRLIEGQYPDYAAIVPEEHTTEISITKSELDNGIKLASIFSRDLGNMVKIIADGEEIKALSQPTESGSNSTIMKGEIEGEDIEIAFNARYLLDFLAIINSEEILLRATEPVKPGLFKIVGMDNYFYLVMPMKANW
jgi:DNA polymerase III subunit beta